MSLNDEALALRRALNKNIGYRVLEDDDIVQHGDESICASSLLGDDEEAEWYVMKVADFGDFFGCSVRSLNDPTHNKEMDVEERLFRRKIGKHGEKAKKKRADG